jgi:AhpD family alkylhydroperoxidase
VSGIETPRHYTYSWYIRPLLFLLRRKGGDLSDSVRLWGRTPMAFIGFLFTMGALERRASKLDPELRALIRTRVSQIDLCEFCIGLNGNKALERGVTQAKLLDLSEFINSQLYNESEKIALSFTETITSTGYVVNTEMMKKLKHHFSDDAVVELAALVAHQNFSTKFNRALGVSE